MENTPLTVAAWPRAILHVDADAFFASVEEALVPALRGRPVVTGQERGIIACANYAAKAAGVQRGVQLHIARRMCPGLVVLPSDYETYGLFSRRMFAIMRRFTPQVEEYSIDEAFLDITGMRRVFRASYEEIAQRLQRTIREELDITVSVGLSLSKGLAKLCSKFRKPSGFTAVPGLYIHLLLQRTALAKVWGFGPNTVSLLEKQGLRTAYDFVRQPEPWVQRWLHKPGRDLWHELRGDSVWPVSGEEPPPQATVMRSKTFTPPSDDPEFVFARLTRNVEAAFAKLRRHRLRARAVGVVLRRQDFRFDHYSFSTCRKSSSTGVGRPKMVTMALILALASLTSSTTPVKCRKGPSVMRMPSPFSNWMASLGLPALEEAVRSKMPWISAAGRGVGLGSPKKWLTPGMPLMSQ